MRPTRILLALSFCLGLTTNVFLAQNSEYSPPKLDEKHVFDSILPQERVDLFSGALILSFRDVHIPGPAGFDLDVIRWYNSKINIKNSSCVTVQFEETSLGIGWYMHLGRLYVNPLTGGEPQFRLELPGGQQEEFFGQATVAVPANALVSRNAWILQKNKLLPDGKMYHVAISPAGIEYRFWTGGGTFNDYYYLTTKADPIGNLIQVTYEPRMNAGAYPKTVTLYSANPADTFTPTVTFVYTTSQSGDPDPLTKIQFKNVTGVTVEYLYNVGGTNGQPTLGTSGHQGLLSATTPSPTSLTTTFNYDLRTGETSEDVELKSMTLPTGQVLRYFYQDHSFFYPCHATYQGTECTRVVNQREAVGVGIWNYTWPTGTSTDGTTVVEDPLHNVERDTFQRYPSSGSPTLWKIGLLLHREIQDATSGILRSEDFTYSSAQISTVQVSPSLACSELLQAPRLDEHAVTPTSGGSTKTSRTQYSSYDAYGNPGLVKENNYQNTLIRQRTLLYAHRSGGQWDPTNEYIVDRPAQITLKDSDGLTTRRDTKYTYYINNTGVASLAKVQREEHWVDKLGDFATTNVFLATDYEYDDGGNMSKRIRRSTSGDRTTTLVQAYGTLKSLSDQEGTIFTRQISQYTGSVTSQTDPNAKTTSFSYDNLGRLSGVAPLIGDPTDIVYDNTTAEAVTVTQGISETRYEYDGLGRPVLTRRLLSSGLYSYNRVLYDAVGNVLKSYEADFSDPSGSAPAVVRTYDALGRPKTQQDPFGT